LFYSWRMPVTRFHSSGFKIDHQVEGWVMNFNQQINPRTTMNVMQFVCQFLICITRPFFIPKHVLLLQAQNAKILSGYRSLSESGSRRTEQLECAGAPALLTMDNRLTVYVDITYFNSINIWFADQFKWKILINNNGARFEFWHHTYHVWLIGVLV